MPDERRQGDLLIMDKLSAMHTDLALNTQATKQNTEQLIKLNGKVAAHEVRQQSIEANQAVMATALAQIQDKENTQQKTKNNWLDWLLKGLVVVGLALFYYLLTNAGNFPDFLS